MTYKSRYDEKGSSNFLQVRTNGKWGTCDWSFENGVLTISGGVGASTGIRNENDYVKNDVPWKSFQDSNNITKINIEGQITFEKGTCLSYLFSGADEINGLEKLDTSNVTDMSSMFRFCHATTLDLSTLDTSNVTNMTSMFENSFLQELNISNFDTSNVTNMARMFANSSSLQELNISNFNTSNVTDMKTMFYGCFKLTTLDVSNFNTSNVTDMTAMFGECSKLTTLDVSNFNTSNVTNMEGMFYGCTKLKELDVSNFDTSKVTNMYIMFSFCDNLTSLDLSDFDLSSIGKCSINSSDSESEQISASQDIIKDCKNLKKIIMPKNLGTEYRNHNIDNFNTP